MSAFKDRLKSAIESDEKIATWYHAVGKLGVSNLHYKQEQFLDNCLDRMYEFLENGDYQGLCKVAAKYYKKATTDQLRDAVAEMWDRYTTVLFLMGVETPEVDLLEV